MKTNRRDFFKLAGVAGAGVMSSGLISCDSENGKNRSEFLSNIEKTAKEKHQQRFNMSGYAAPKIETVRLGIIGLGMRGPGAVQRMCNIEGVEIKGLCDKSMDRVEKAQKDTLRLWFAPCKGLWWKSRSMERNVPES